MSDSFFCGRFCLSYILAYRPGSGVPSGSTRGYYKTIRFLVVQQFYQSEVNNEYVIRGNSAVMKCSIPSFVADFVEVISWADTDGNAFALNNSNYGNVSKVAVLVD